MGFPVVIASKSVSARRLDDAPTERAENDGGYAFHAPLILPPGHEDDLPWYDHGHSSDADDRPYNVQRRSERAVATATSADQQIQAWVSVSYFDIRMRRSAAPTERNNAGHIVTSKAQIIAQARVLFVPAGEPLSRKQKESVFRVALPSSSASELEASNQSVYSTSEDRKEVAEKDSADSTAEIWRRCTACFSADNRSLACLIPCPAGLIRPHDYPESQKKGSDPVLGSILVHFSLKRPRTLSSGQRGLSSWEAAATYMQPSYLQGPRAATAANQTAISTPSSFASRESDQELVVPVATNPKVMWWDPTQGERLISDRRPSNPNEVNGHVAGRLSWFLQATSICDVASETVGRFRGGTASPSNPTPSVLLVGCRDGRILVVSYRPWVVAGMAYDHFPNEASSSRRREGWVYMDHCLNERQAPHQDGSMGRLVVIGQSGRTVVLQSHLLMVSTLSDAHNENDLPLESERSHSSFMSVTRSTTSAPHAKTLLIALSKEFELDQPIVCAKWTSSLHLAVIRPPDTMCVVEVLALAEKGGSQAISTMEMTWDGLLEEAHTICTVPGKDSNDMNGSTVSAAPMSLDYDSSLDCFSICAFVRSSDAKQRCPLACIWHWRTNTQGLTILMSNQQCREDAHTPPQCVESSFCFALDGKGGRKLTHTFFAPSSRKTFSLRRELYECAILSPPRSLRSNGSRLEPSNALLLSSKSVSFPYMSKVSVLDEFEVEWREEGIPSHYLTICGAPLLGDMTSRLGRSVVVAGSRGFCMLDCAVQIFEQSSTESTGKVGSMSSLKTRIGVPRWSLFANEAEEQLFRVVAMSWWEGPATLPPNVDRLLVLDLLVAVIEVLDGSEKGLYLSCWSARSLRIKDQLLRVPSMLEFSKSVSRWGIPLPADFHPESLDVLSQQEAPMHSRKALALLADGNYSTSYEIFQLEYLIGSQESSDESLPCYVLGSCRATGSLGYPSQVFLAGGSLSFSLQNFPVAHDAVADKHLVTLGVLKHQGGGLVEISLSTLGASDHNDVLRLNSNDGDFVRYWLGDTCTSSVEDVCSDSCAWVLQTRSGHLFTWLVPCSSEDGVIIRGSQGTLYPAGDTTMWMQPSALRTRKEFPTCSLPQSHFGCVMGVSQGCTKLHRSLGESFKNEVFRPDFLAHEAFCPSDISLGPPAFLPALYAITLEGSKRNIPMAIIHKHIKERMTKCLFRETSLLSLQLLLLRVVECLAAGSKSVQDPFVILVESLRKNSTPLQFSNLMLGIGRQIEPSCFRFFLPLPQALDDDCLPCRTVGDLFEITLLSGSITSAVAALPLLTERKATALVAAAAFQFCLSILNSVYRQRSKRMNYLYKEARLAAKQLFRYALRLEDSKEEHNRDRLDSDELYGVDQDLYYDDWEERTSIKEERGYSIMCGMSRWFSPKKEEKAILKAASSFIGHGFDHDMAPAGTANGFHQATTTMMSDTSSDVVSSTVRDLASRFLLSAAFSQENSGHSPWKRAAWFSQVLIGDDLDGFEHCTAANLATILRSLDQASADPSVLFEGTDGGLAAFFSFHMAFCRQQISAAAASRILDLVLILLGTDRNDDLLPDTPLLVLLALISADVAQRIHDIILVDEGRSHNIWVAYSTARPEGVYQPTS